MVSTNFKSDSNFESVLEKLNGLPFMRPAQAKWLNKFITTNKLYNVLEIGFHHGKSTALIAATLADAGHGELISIDRNLSLQLKPEAGELLHELNLDVTIKLIHAERSYTWELSKLIAMDQPPKFDLCYFDAGHELDSTSLGFLLVNRLLKPGGWIVFDDMDWTIQKSLNRRGLTTEKSRFYNYSKDELLTPAVRRVFELLVASEGYEEMQSIERLGWGVARKKSEALGKYGTENSNPNSNKQNVQATKIIKHNSYIDNSINSKNHESLNKRKESVKKDADSMHQHNAEQEVLRDIQDIWLDSKFNYVDIGAYDGTFALKVAESGLPVREMHLIEAEPEAYSNLCNIFKKKTLAYCYQIAAGEKTKEIILRKAKTLTSSMPGNKQLSNRDICVNCTPLDEILLGRVREGITFMKIDVEGMELEVIKGAQQLLGNGNTSMVYIEVGFNQPQGIKEVETKGIYQQTNFLDVYNSLDSLGFKLCKFYEQKNNWIQDTPALRRANALFIHKEFIKTHPFRLAGRLNKMQKELNSLRNIIENKTPKRDLLNKSKIIEKINEIETEIKSFKKLDFGEKGL